MGEFYPDYNISNADRSTNRKGCILGGFFVYVNNLSVHKCGMSELKLVSLDNVTGALTKAVIDTGSFTT